jgi:hypothetical protein
MGEVDRKVFGTGDRLGYVTLTGDETFPTTAAGYRVELNVRIHTRARYSGL